MENNPLKETVRTKKRLYRCECKHTFYTPYEKQRFFARLFRKKLFVECGQCGNKKTKYIKAITKVRTIKDEGNSMTEKEIFVEQKKLLEECKTIIRELITVSAPFTSCDTVTETSGTIPLMEKLEDTIRTANGFLAVRE